jgi:hypothetical protein
MAKEQELITKLINTLDKAVADVNGSIPGIESDISKEIDQLLKSLDIRGDNIKANVANLKKIALFKTKIQRIINQSDYPDKIKNFLQDFTEIAAIQNQYFAAIAIDFSPQKILTEIKVQSIDSAIESLTEAGLNANLINPVHDLLLKNVTTGGSYSSLSGQLRDFLKTSDNGLGALTKYVKQITTDSINQFSGQYMNAIANDLNLDWGMYVGSLITTSRPFCVACVKKRYIHRSELEQVIEGNFPEFKEAGGVIYDKTGLPSGMIPGTNASNFQVYRGGFNCGHSYIPISLEMVPESAKALLI